MREIKFRAWDKKESQMCLNANVMGANTPGIQADWDFMQYTGHKDKNGKEIYEGDIFCWNWHESPIVRVVEFHNGCFIGRDVEHIVPMEHLGDFPLSKVIIAGNIYENPELLK